VVTRHQFLSMLHDLLKPHVYLEVGVQYGLSLDLAVHSEQAWGIDINPQVQAKGNQIIVPYDSRLALSGIFSGPKPRHVDLAFIDGSHLYEDALNDFVNISRLCGPSSVVVFDDVLPYNSEIAGREPLPGDWTGDVWKLYPILEPYVPNIYLVNTFPTGTMVTWGDPDLAMLEANLPDITRYWHTVTQVPDHVLSREYARDPQIVIEAIQEDLL